MNATTNEPRPGTDLPARPSEPSVTRSFPKMLLVALTLAAGGLLTAGILPRMTRDASASRTQEQGSSALKVNIDSPKISAKAFDITLPGSTRAMQETTLYARTSGFVSQILTDIGDTVREGQLLAVIESPELDEELIRARVRVQEAKANFVLARSTLDRIQSLLKTRAVSEQENDDQQARVNSAEAALRGGEAEVRRLESLQSFEKVLAPFPGVITSRTAEKGNLITAGSGSALPSLFTLAQEDTLRIFLDVPQKYAVAVKPGSMATILVRERSGRAFEGKVVRTSGSLDPASRTLLAEIHLPNPDRALLPGMYVQVKLSLERDEPAILIPARTLAILNSGPHVVTVEPDGTIQHRPVTLGRDFGGEIEVSAGLKGNERLVANPSDSLKDGQAVQVETSSALAKKSGS
jgi:membrane fusion protein (multidrug efflux system)